MSKIAKRVQAFTGDRSKTLALEEAVKQVKANAKAKFDDFPGLEPTYLAVNEAIGSGLGKVQKVEQTKTTQTGHSGLPAVMT